MLWERKHSPGRGEGPRVAPGNGNRADLNLPPEPSSVPVLESQLSPTDGDGPAFQAPAATNAIIETAPAPGASGQTIIARSTLIRGELWVREDLVIDGQFEGTLPVDGHRITVGAGGRVKSELHAREVVVHGAVNGDIKADDKIEVSKTAHITGNLVAGRVIVEAGAYLKGNVNTLR